MQEEPIASADMHNAGDAPAVQDSPAEGSYTARIAIQKEVRLSLQRASWSCLAKMLQVCCTPSHHLLHARLIASFAFAALPGPTFEASWQ